MGDSKKEKPVRKTRTWACIGLSSLLGVVLVIGGILVCILFKDFLENMIRDQIPLRVGSKITDAWLHPPVKPLMRLYFFNTTNPEGFLKGEKPFLVEMGPYTWEETMEKVGVVWGEDGSTVKYSVKRTYRFRRDLSIGGVEDRVTLPNIPMFGSINQMRWAGKLVQQALSSMLDILKQEVFNSTTVGEIVWGFDHPLIKLGNDVLPPEKKLPFDKFGFFTNRNNSVEGEFEIMTGMDGLHNIGELVSFQGKQKMNMWNSDECDNIRGSDGTLFHPALVRNETLHMYNKALCQSLPLVYQEDVDHHGVNTYRFVPPSNVFGTPKENPKNKCYCKEEPCAPSGLFNVSACQFGSPVMLSWPHFYQADPSLVDAVDGLNPTREKHQFQMDLVPKMGIAMHATARSQINLVMQAQEHVKQLQGVRDIIYPIFWFQTGVDELPEDTVNLLQMAVHAPERARSILYPILFAVGALLILSVVAYLVKRLRNTSRKEEKVENGGHQLPGKTTQARTPPPDYNESA